MIATVSRDRRGRRAPQCRKGLGGGLAMPRTPRPTPTKPAAGPAAMQKARIAFAGAEVRG